MGLDSTQIHALVQAKFPQAIVEDQAAAVDPFLVIRPEELESIAFFCRDDESLQLDMLSCITGVDYPERQAIEVIYSLDSTKQHHRLTIKVQLPRDNPTVSTVENVWRTADWHERETYDLLGVDFARHHNLIRILCAEDWEGHPLRKDYVMPESYHGIKNVVY